MLVLLLVTGVCGFTTNYARRYIGRQGQRAPPARHAPGDPPPPLRARLLAPRRAVDRRRHVPGDRRPHADPGVLLLRPDARRQHDAARRRARRDVRAVAAAQPRRRRVRPGVRVRRHPLPRPRVPGDVERPAPRRRRSPASSTRPSPACASSRRSPRSSGSSTASPTGPTSCTSRGCARRAINARYSSTLQVLPMLAQLGVLAFGGWLALRGHLTLGVFLAFASYLVQIITPVRLVSSLMATTQQARAGAERVFELLDMEPRVADAPDAVPVTDAARRDRARPRRLRPPRRPGDAARRLADDPARRAHRPRRRVGLRQVDARLPDGPLLRPDVRHRPPRRRRRPPLHARLAARRPSTWCSRRASCSRRRSARTSPSPGPGRPTPRSRPRPVSPTPTTSSPRCRRATTRSSASAATRCRAASASASPSPAPPSPNRPCSSSTTPRRPSTPTPRRPSSSRSRSASGDVHDGPHRPPLVDAAPRRPGARPRRRPHRRRGHERRAVAHVASSTASC